MKTEIANIKAQIKALYLKESAQDFSEAWGEIRDYGNDFDDEAQEEMGNKAQTSWGRNHSQYYWEQDRGSWASSPEFVKVEEIGQANINQKKGVILASYNAG